MRPLRIIIVDDDPDDVALATRLLVAERDWQARHVSSATAFAEELKRGEFEAVLLESRVAWSDGLAIARTVRQSTSAKALVLFARATTETFLSDALSAGIDGFAPKSSRGFAQLAETMRGAWGRALERARPDVGPFRLLVEKTTTALVFRCTLDGTLLESSGPYSSLTGLNPADPGEGSFLDRILPADRRDGALDRLRRSGIVRLAEVPLGRPGTKEVLCTLKAVLTTNDSGQQILTGTLDVTGSAMTSGRVTAPASRPGQNAVSFAPGPRRLQAVGTSLPPAPVPGVKPSGREETPALAHRALAAAHDLKEPLRTLVHYSELLRTRYRGQLDTDADEYLSFVHEASLRMRSQVSRLFAEGAEISGTKPRSTDTLAVFDRVVKYLRASITATKAEVTHGLLPSLPIAEEDLVQILQNLIGNALKFHSDAPPRVHLDVSRTGSEWLVSVEDNGVGIAAEDMPRLFALFERGHRSGGIPGTGIGLALCKNIAERNGGRIWASRNVNGGTTFFFTLPLSGDSNGSTEEATVTALRPSR